MRTAFGVDASLGQAQTLDGATANQVLLHYVRSVGCLHVAVPDGVRVDNDNRAMFALVKAAGLVDANSWSKAGRPRQLLQLGVKFALSISSARWPWRIGGTDIVANKNVALKRGQAVFLLGADNQPE